MAQKPTQMGQLINLTLIFWAHTLVIDLYEKGVHECRYSVGIFRT